jgi:hypothetical protein
MNTIKERIDKRAALILRMEQLQKTDRNKLGLRDPNAALTNEDILKGLLKCSRKDFESVFWRHRASGKVNQIAKNVRIRQLYFYLCRTITLSTLKETGIVKNNGETYQVFDHATVIHGIQSHQNLVDIYAADRDFTKLVTRYLKNL